jgi:hypothetical protein
MRLVFTRTKNISVGRSEMKMPRKLVCKRPGGRLICKSLVPAILGLLLVFETGHSVVPGPFFCPATGNYYEEVFIGERNWIESRNYAETLSYQGLPGHLVTIESEAEQACINAHAVQSDEAWIGGYQPPGSKEPAGNWRWVGGELITYNGFKDGEPDDNNDEDCLVNEAPLSPKNEAANGSPFGWNDKDCDRRDIEYAFVEFEAPQESVPTLSALGIIIFSLFVTISAIWVLKRRRITA